MQPVKLCFPYNARADPTSGTKMATKVVGLYWPYISGHVSRGLQAKIITTKMENHADLPGKKRNVVKN